MTYERVFTVTGLGVFVIQCLGTCLCAWEGPGFKIERYFDSPPGNNETLQMTGLTLRECRRQCRARMWCVNAAYIRRFHVCKLHPEISNPVLVPTPGVLLMTGFDKYHEESPECGSNENCGDQTCVRNSYCSTTECRFPVEYRDQFDIKGNMLSVGRTLRLQNNGDSSDIKYKMCMSTGSWMERCRSSTSRAQAPANAPSCVATDTTTTDADTSRDVTDTSNITLSSNVTDVYIIILENYTLNDACAIADSLYFTSTTVELDDTYSIRAMHVFNRDGSCAARAQRISVYLGDTADNLQQQTYYESSSGQECIYALTSTVNARHVQVLVESNVVVAEICSIAFFADGIVYQTPTTTPAAVGSLPT